MVALRIASRMTIGNAAECEVFQRPQPSSASRVTAGAFGFLTFTQWGDRPRS